MTAGGGNQQVFQLDYLTLDGTLGGQYGEAYSLGYNDMFQKIGTGLGVPASYDRMFAGSLNVKNSITNVCNAMVTCTIYEFVWKRNFRNGAPRTFEEIWKDSIENSHFGADNLTTGYHIDVPGQSPFHAIPYQLGKWVKIIKTTRLILNPGQVHTHYFTRAYNKVWKKESFIDLSQSTQPAHSRVAAGWTVGQLFIVHGSTGVDQSNTAHTSPSRIAVRTWSKITCRRVVDSAARFHKFAEIGAATGAIEVLNDDNGQPETYAFAGA